MFTKTSIVMAAVVATACPVSQVLAQRLQPRPENPRWLQYGTRPLALSGNGLWGVIYIDDMDYPAHNEHCVKWGGNSNRASLFSFITSYNTPTPWQRAGPGLANDGKPKFDLTRPNDAYWTRAGEYFKECRARGIFPVIQVWGEPYLEAQVNAGERWRLHPFNPDNNVNNIADLPSGQADAGTDTAFYNTGNRKLMELQERFVTRALDELGKYPVIWDIGNEVGLDTSISDRWMQHWADRFDDYEAGHPGITILSTVDTNVDRGHYDRIRNLDVINVHGSRQSHPFTLKADPVGRPDHSRVDVKRLQRKLDRLFAKDKRPLLNSRITSDPDRERSLRDRPGNVLESRHILWGLFFSATHFGSFRNEARQSWTQPPLTTEHAQRSLRAFIRSFAFHRCTPRVTGIVATGDAVVLAETHRQYAFYAPNGIHFGDRFEADLSEAAKMSFRARWFDPRRGQFGEPFRVDGGKSVMFELPTDEDWALLLDREK